jgi:hypothetical protein
VCQGSECAGLARTIYVCIYSVFTVFLARESPNIRYTVYIIRSGPELLANQRNCESFTGGDFQKRANEIGVSNK